MTVSLGSVTRMVGGGTPTRSKSAYYGGDIPWVTPKDMKQWDVRGAQVSLTELGVQSSSTRVVPAGSVLIVIRSGVLKHTLPVGVARVPVAINQDMKALLCGDDVYPDYLARLLCARSAEILSWVRATTADNFSSEQLKELQVALPVLDEQRRIAEILDQADALRAERREALALLDDFRRSMFHDMFASSRDPGWERTTVEHLLDLERGGIRTGPFGSQLLHSEFVDEGIGVLGIDNVVTNEFKWNGHRFITEEKYRQLSRYTVHPGDVLITIMGTCGRAAIVPDDIPTSINTKHLCCVSLDHLRCTASYLHAYFLLHPIARSYLQSAAKGAIMSGLNMGIIQSLPVVVPPIDLQIA